MKDFFAGEKLCLIWCCLGGIVRANSNYLNQVEYLMNGAIGTIHASWLKFYHDPSCDQKVFVDDVLSSEIGMPVSHMQKREESGKRARNQSTGEIIGLSNNNSTMEPFAQVYEDVPDILKTLLDECNTRRDLTR